MSDSPSAAMPAPRNVARAVVMKAQDVFFLTRHSGEVPPGNQDGFGLYYHDCRYLNGYRILLAGTSPNALVATAARGFAAEFEMTNEELRISAGKTVPAQTFGISLERVIDGEHLTVHDVFTIQNYAIEEQELPLEFQFDSGFEDIFEIRGIHPKKTGKAKAPRWHNRVLVFSYSGADGVQRRLEVHPDPPPRKASGANPVFSLRLGPGERRQIRISLRIIESRAEPEPPHRISAELGKAAGAAGRRTEDWLARYAEVQTDNPLLNEVVGRSLRDLGILESSLDDCEFFAAGLPWYGALFGRDSIIAALQTLAFEPQIAEQTARLLARHQGRGNDDWRDMQPGKILHELRRGELANLNEIPQTPYYGSVDSTPLFLILVGEHANWTGSLRLFEEIRENIERALHWIDTFGAEAQGGYLSYASKSSGGLGNQGWKDSGDSIMNADGSLAEPPIALVEVQGYVYRAKLLMAGLYERSGDHPTAARLRAEAEELKSRFNRDFWLEDRQFYALALQKGGRPAEVISSNPGQALWTGIVDNARAADVMRHLISDDMFSGWGIRTLSRKERRYNPIGYHLGTVWPHDNSLIAAGLRRYGFDMAALRVMSGMLEAARHFAHYRLPEVFAGFPREEFPEPVRYPVACHPQAWAAGSVPFLLDALLGLVPDAFNGRLRVVRPVLPEGVRELEFRRVKIGDGTLDLRFERTAEGTVKAAAVEQTGNVQVQIEPESQPKAA